MKSDCLLGKFKDQADKIGRREGCFIGNESMIRFCKYCNWHCLSVKHALLHSDTVRRIFVEVGVQPAPGLLQLLGPEKENGQVPCNTSFLRE